MIFEMLGGICALAGLLLIGDYLFWASTGQVVASTIVRFEPGKRGPRPVLNYTLADGKEIMATAQRVTHMGYLLANPQEGDVFNAIYQKKEPETVRVYGQLHLVGGMFLFVPLLATYALKYGQQIFATQLAFAVIFAGIMLGGWVALKFIRQNY